MLGAALGRRLVAAGVLRGNPQSGAWWLRQLVYLHHPWLCWRSCNLSTHHTMNAGLNPFEAPVIG
jgi:hypothetical protein